MGVGQFVGNSFESQEVWERKTHVLLSLLLFLIFNGLKKYPTLAGTHFQSYNPNQAFMQFPLLILTVDGKPLELATLLSDVSPL